MTRSTNGPSPQASPSKLTCERVTELIIDYMTGDLAPAVSAAFETHLYRCQDCEVFLKTYRETIQVTRTVSYDTIPPEMLNRIHQFFDEQRLDT